MPLIWHVLAGYFNGRFYQFGKKNEWERERESVPISCFLSLSLERSNEYKNNLEKKVFY